MYIIKVELGTSRIDKILLKGEEDDSGYSLMHTGNEGTLKKDVMLFN